MFHLDKYIGDGEHFVTHGVNIPGLFGRLNMLTHYISGYGFRLRIPVESYICTCTLVGCSKLIHAQGKNVNSYIHH